MHPRKAFNETIDRYQIKAVDIAKATGLAESYISKYRSGQAGNIGNETLIKMVKTFPIEAQWYFWSLCMSREDGNESTNRDKENFAKLIKKVGLGIASLKNARSC